MLHGQEDTLVPWSTQFEFISYLQTQSGNIEIKLYDGIGHKVTAEMVEDFYEWLLKYILV